ncbi:DegV family protein [Agaribacterium haliotis]|uniref:DegV family protein n=1 Tax=Agaribacterium haliotis TaxID=2013869 RepID=UPI000BB534B3|nr:DegV family protein [Agaribacterium haliotis]
MKTAILVDSACHLPKAFCEKYNVGLVPLTYSIDGRERSDSCIDYDALALFKSGELARKHEVSTRAPSAERFEAAILAKAKQGFERIIVQTVNRTQGETYNNATAGVALAEAKLKEKNITLRVMDSRTAFAGQALMAAETIRRMLKSEDEAAVRRSMDKISEKIHSYILPKEPLVAWERAKQRNENSVSRGQVLLANALGIYPIICNVNDASSSVAKIPGFKKAAKKLFQNVARCIENQPLCPIVTINYCGSLEQLKALPGYAELAAVAKNNKIMLISSVASVASGIYASPGSLSVAVATDEPDWR